MGRPITGRIPNFSIRIKPHALNKAREAAFSHEKTLGCWLEEAINEKVEREANPHNKAHKL